MTLLLVWCHVSPKISVFMLLVSSKLDWHNTLSLDILMFIATQYSPCWGVLDYLATLGTVNVQVIHVWRHVSKITTRGWCICEIDSRRQVSLQEVSPEYDQSALEQSAIYFVIVTSGHDVHQSVQFCCPGTVHLDWNNIPQAVFNTLIRPMRRRCQACINANGGHTCCWLCWCPKDPCIVQNIYQVTLNVIRLIVWWKMHYLAIRIYCTQ
jgi:hypothetical protein